MSIYGDPHHCTARNTENWLKKIPYLNKIAPDCHSSTILEPPNDKKVRTTTFLDIFVITTTLTTNTCILKS